MFERYTESARRVLFFARYAVSELGGVSIETHHLLSGLLRDEKGIVGTILATRGIDAEGLRREIEQRRAPERIPTAVEVPFDSDMKRALEHAKDEAERLQHTYIGTEHLLLGLLREERSTGGSMLAARGLHLEDARALVIKLLQERPTHSTTPRNNALAERAKTIARIEAVETLVAQLARSAPDTTELRDLVAQIGGELRSLKTHFER